MGKWQFWGNKIEEFAIIVIFDGFTTIGNSNFKAFSWFSLEKNVLGTNSGVLDWIVVENTTLIVVFDDYLCIFTIFPVKQHKIMRTLLMYIDRLRFGLR